LRPTLNSLIKNGSFWHLIELLWQYYFAVMIMSHHVLFVSNIKKETKMYYKFFRIVFVLILIIGLTAIPAPQSVRAAGPWYVSTTGDDGNDCLSPSTPCLTIKGAMDKSLSGETIYVAVGTYSDNNYGTALNISKNTTLSGGWNNSFTLRTGLSTIDGQNTVTGVSMSGGVVTIDHFIIQNGYGYYSAAGGGISNWGGDLTVINSIVKNNQAPRSGGGGIWSYGGNLTLANSAVINNTTTQNGGGVYISNSGNATINNSSISGNTAISAY